MGEAEGFSRYLEISRLCEKNRQRSNGKERAKEFRD